MVQRVQRECITRKAHSSRATYGTPDARGRSVIKKIRVDRVDSLDQPRKSAVFHAQPYGPLIGPLWTVMPLGSLINQKPRAKRLGSLLGAGATCGER